MSQTFHGLILASASPRRRELLRYLGVRFGSIATDAELQENAPAPAAISAALPPLDLPLDSHPTLIAWRKVIAACTLAANSVIIGADTIVVFAGQALGKPTDSEHARAMLRLLSGCTHIVYTGLAVIDAQGRPLLDLVASDVTFVELNDAMIDAYLATGEPFDKAGAYGIQGLGGRLVHEVRGSYTNVVGLPLWHTYQLLAAAGVDCPTDPSDAYMHWLGDQGKEPLPCPPTFL